MSNKKVDVYNTMFGVVEPDDLGAICTVDQVDEALGFPASMVVQGSPIARLNWDTAAHSSIKEKTITKLVSKEGWQDLTINGVNYDQGQSFADLQAQQSALVFNEFKGSDFTQADFSVANIVKCSFNKCNFNGSVFNQLKLYDSVFDNCTFSNIEFDRVNFLEAQFTDCKFINCSFVGTIIKKSDFVDCVIQNSEFDTDYWHDIVVNDTKLESNNISKATFSKIRIISTELTDNTFNKIVFTNTKIEDSKFIKNIWLMVGFDKGNVLENITMQDEHLQRCNFKYSTWMDVKSTNMKVNNLNFSEAKLLDCEFTGTQGAGFNLVVARLFNTQLNNCDIPNSNWTGAMFDDDSRPLGCSLEGLIYAYSEMANHKILEPQIKTKSRAKVKQIDYREIRKGIPAVKGEIVSLTKEIKPSKVVQADGIYEVTGTTTLSGDITVINTMNRSMNMAELETNRSSLETEARVTISHAIADIEINNYDEQKLKMVTHLGIFDLTIDSFAQGPNQKYIKGSLSTNSEKINNKYKDSKLEGTINIGFDLVATKQDNDEAASAAIKKEKPQENNYVFKTFLVGIVAISCIANPELTPAIIAVGGASIAN